MKSRLSGCAIAMMALVGFVACGDDAAVEETGPGLIGVVVDAETGAPVSGAVVRRYQSTSSMAETDENGAFAFEDASADQAALLTVSADGYQFAKKTITAADFQPADDGMDTAMPPADDGIEFSDGILVVTIEMTKEPPEVPTPVIRIIGVVVDGTTNMPIEGATVARHQATSSEKTTAQDGSFVFEDALYAPATLTVQADGYDFAQMKVAITDFARDGVVPGMGMTAMMDTEIAGNASATVSVQLMMAAPTGVEITREITGHVFLQDLIPAKGAEVMLVQGGLVYATTMSDDNGVFSFADVPFARIDTQYQIVVAPFDDDGDGWADTGVDVTNGVCLYGITQADCPDPDAGPIPNVGGLSNVVLRLQAPNHSILANNACNAPFIRADQSLFLLFDTSVDKGTFDAVLFAPDGSEVATKADWTGSYLVRLTPEKDFAKSEDGDDQYRLEVRSVVFDDGFVLYDPTNVGSLLACTFQVGTNATYLESPEPRLWRNANEAITSVDADVVSYYDTTGRLVRTSTYSALQIVFPHVPGAVNYSIRAKDTLGDDKTWTEVATRSVGTEWTPKDVLATINLSGFGLLGEVLGFGNQLDIMVKPIDSNGHVAPETGSEPKLRLKDSQKPYLSSIGWAPDTSEAPDATSLGDLAISYNASMDVSLSPESITVRSGRISAIDLSEANSYWGSATPSSPAASLLQVENVMFTVNTGKDIKVQMHANNGDSLLETAELPSGFDLKGYAIGQRVGVFDSDATSVAYVNVLGINTKVGALQLSGGVPLDVNDVVFDPRGRTDTLVAEAREGAMSIKVNDASKFFVGQQLYVRSSTDANLVTVASLDTGTDVITLTGSMSQSRPVGAHVLDRELVDSIGDHVPRGAVVLDAGSERLITPTALAANTSLLEFNSFVSLNTLTVGDMLLFDADGDWRTLTDRATATVTHIKTILGDGTSILDSNMVAVSQLEIGSVTFLGDAPTPLPLDPRMSAVLAEGDVIEVSDSYSHDSSGNAGVLSTFSRGNMLSASAPALTIWGK